MISSLSRIPLFSSLDNDDLLRVERLGEERTIRGKQLVFLFDQKNDYVFVLKTGRLKLVRISSSGREVAFSLIDPQEVFGETGLFTPDSTYPYSCEALEESTLVCFHKSDIEGIIGLSSTAMIALYQLQAKRRLEAETKLSDLIIFDVSSRLAQLLVNLSARYGRATKVGTVLRLKITHQDLANLIGSTRETTTLILSEFKRRGLIDFAGRKIVIIDRDQLVSTEGASYLHKTVVLPR